MEKATGYRDAGGVPFPMLKSMNFLMLNEKMAKSENGEGEKVFWVL